jgi:hypothetical protein
MPPRSVESVAEEGTNATCVLESWVVGDHMYLGRRRCRELDEFVSLLDVEAARLAPFPGLRSNAKVTRIVDITDVRRHSGESGEDEPICGTGLECSPRWFDPDDAQSTFAGCRDQLIRDGSAGVRLRSVEGHLHFVPQFVAGNPHVDPQNVLNVRTDSR